MATSPVYISNLALGMLGNASRIQSMTDMSPQAKAANLWYSSAIDFTLSQRDWSFARRQAPLALHADDPPQQWAYFYQTPADLLVARYLAAPPYYTGHKIPFELLASADGETVGLATNLEDAELIYTRRVSQPAVFTPWFVKLAARSLAADMAYTITGSRAEEDSQRQKFYAELRGASANDANQGADDEPPDSDMITGRY